MSAADVREVESLKGGLTLEDYRRRKEEMQQDATLKSLHASVASAVGLPAGAGADADRQAKKKRKKGRAPGGAGLSFDDDGEADAPDGPAASEPPAPKRVFKAPGVDTSFLAKNASEKQDEARRQQELLRQMLAAKERQKNEEVELHYHFRNEAAKKLLGSQFYRGSVIARRGEPVSALLDAIHAKLSAELAEKVSSQLLLGVSNEYLGIIAQNSMSLFDICGLQWAEGGSMFELGRSQLVVVERGFYESNRHLHPMNGWTLFDPFKKYSHDAAVRNREKSSGVEVQRGKAGAGGAGNKPKR